MLVPVSRRYHLPLAVVASVIAFAGCSGASTSVPPLGGGGPTASPAAPATAAFSIVVPPGASTTSAARSARYTSPNTKSVTITLQSSGGVAATGPSVTIATAAGAPNCSSGASGLTCTATLTVPSGSDVFAISAFSQPNGGGSALSAGTATVTLQAGSSTPVPLTLGGVVSSVSVSLGGSIVSGKPANVPVTVTAKDASGATIIGADPYAAPIALSDNDASGTTQLSTTSVTSPGTTITLVYNGQPVTASITVTASAPGVPASSSATLTVTLSGTGAPYADGETRTFSRIDSVDGTPAPAVTIEQTIHANATFNGVSGLYDVHTTPLETPFRPNKSGSVLGGLILSVQPVDEYFGLQTTANGVRLYDYGYTESGTSFQSTVVLAPALVDKLPETAGDTWNSAVNATITTPGAGYTHVTASDGSYVECSEINGQNGGVILNSTIVSSSHDAVIEGRTGPSATAADQTRTFAMAHVSAPVGGAVTEVDSSTSTTDKSVSVGHCNGATISPLPAGLPAPTTSSKMLAVSYDAHSGVPLETDVYVNNGLVTLPAQCTGASAVVAPGTKAVDIHEVDTYLDPIPIVGKDGTARALHDATQTTDQYSVAGIGMVCTIASTVDRGTGDTSYANATTPVSGGHTVRSVTVLTHINGGASSATNRAAQSVGPSVLSTAFGRIGRRRLTQPAAERSMLFGTRSAGS